MRKFSITDKLIIASFLLSIIIIIIVASFSFINAKSAILDRSFNQLNSVRVIKTNLIEKFFINKIKEIKLISTSSDIRSIVTKLNSTKTTNKYNIIADNTILNNNFINEILKEQYKNIVIIGENKSVLPIKNNIDIKDTASYNLLWNRTVSGGGTTYIQDFEKLHKNTFTNLKISSKITDSLHNIIGIIVFEISSNAIDSTMLNKAPSNGLGISGESYLVGNDYLMRSSSRFQKKSILSTIVKTYATNSCFANKPGTKVIKDYRKITVLSSYSRIDIPQLNWAIIAEIDYKEVTVPIYKIRNEIIFISIFIFLIVLIIIIVFSRNITIPIEKLNRAAHQIGSGNLDVQIKLSKYSNDEIGELSNTFNLMIKKLKHQSEELEIEKTKSLRSLFDGQEAERHRLSRELHDSLGQLLIGLKLKYESCKNNNNVNNDLSKLFNQTIEETRRISNNLSPVALSEFGLTTAIRNICNEISEISNINIKYNVKGSSKKLSSEIKTYLFRIIQEATTNILKHSKANNAYISLIFEKNFVLIKIEDKGIGFNPQKISNKSNGLNNIKDRVLLLSGKINILSDVSQGTRINILIPVVKIDE